MRIAVLDVDLGKNSCSVVGLDEAGKVVVRRRMRRETVIVFAGTGHLHQKDQRTHALRVGGAERGLICGSCGKVPTVRTWVLIGLPPSEGCACPRMRGSSSRPVNAQRQRPSTQPRR